MTNLIGQSLGRYHILEQLGEGGMATVYKALDTRLQRDVAIKVILPQRQFSAATLKRFEREARALAQLSHPNIVKVLDYGDEEGQPYLVMEYLPGGTLRQLMEKNARNPVKWQSAARLLMPVASALEAAHQQNIIHRDIKPSNILLTQNGQPMLSDFGIAKMLDNEETTDLTGSGVGIGTPQYMAPEQGLGRADARSDIYALGTVFYELVTGRPPYRADTPMAVMLKKSTEPLPRPKKYVPDLPEAVERILLTALSRDPANRYQRMTDFRLALENLAEGYSPPVRNSSFPVYAWWLIGGMGVCLALVLLAALAGLALKNWPLADSPTAVSSPVIVNSPAPVSTLPIIPTDEPTLKPVPTEAPALPTETPVPPTQPVLREEVADFIVNYWNLVSNKNFEAAYQYQSAAFKAKNHPNGINDFISGFKYTASVRVTRVEAISVDQPTAIVDADLEFTDVAGGLLKVFHRYTLIRENGHWAIDGAKKR